MYRLNKFFDLILFLDFRILGESWDKKMQGFFFGDVQKGGYMNWGEWERFSIQIFIYKEYYICCFLIKVIQTVIEI